MLGKIFVGLQFDAWKQLLMISNFEGRKSGLVVIKLNLQSKGCGYKSRLIQYTKRQWGKSHARINTCN